MEEFKARVNLTELTQKVEEIKSELAHYLVGQHQLVEYLINCFIGRRTCVD